MFKYSNSNKRYHTLDYFFKQRFNSKVFKVSLNAGFTCPNIDGTVGTSGCIYCSQSGSGEYAGKKTDDILTQFHNIKNMMLNKWPNGKYIGYFQAHTNTYAPLHILKENYETILKENNVVGLSIATRADAVNIETLEYLSDLNTRTYLTIELGLQTIHETTSTLINRCHTLICFEDMVNELRKRNINVVVHIINGLPYETKDMMLETVKYLNKLDIQGIKIHMLSILKNTKLEKLYIEDNFKLITRDEYINIVCDQLELLRPEIVIHRSTGDPKIEDLIEPDWLIKKVTVLNDIDKEMNRRNSWQGKNV
jgi:radical SAM protein (TIGR01212 family)